MHHTLFMTTVKYRYPLIVYGKTRSTLHL